MSDTNGQRPNPRLVDLDKPAELGPGIVKDGTEYPLTTYATFAADPRLRYRLNAIQSRMGDLDVKESDEGLDETEVDETERLTAEMVGLFLPTMPTEVVASLTTEMRGRIIGHWMEVVGTDPLLDRLTDMAGKASSLTAARSPGRK